LRADAVEDRLDAVSELRQLGQAHHGRRALEAVGRPECLVEVRTIPLAPLEIHQPLFEADQELSRLLVEHLAESIVRATCQSCHPSKRCPTPPVASARDDLAGPVPVPSRGPPPIGPVAWPGPPPPRAHRNCTSRPANLHELTSSRGFSVNAAGAFEST